MKTAIFFEASFNSSHWLPRVHAGHKCRRMHGHTYRVRIELCGEVGEDGFVVDYDVVRRAWARLSTSLDHVTLNEVDGLDNPTCENIAAWIADRLVVERCKIDSVEVRETETCGAIVRLG